MYLSMKSVVRSALDPSSKVPGQELKPFCTNHVTRVTLHDIPQGDAACPIRRDVTSDLA